MLVVHKVEACRRCRATAMWRIMDGCLRCERCQRTRCPRRHASVGPKVAVSLLVIVLAWLTFAFGEERALPERRGPDQTAPASRRATDPSVESLDQQVDRWVLNYCYVIPDPCDPWPYGLLRRARHDGG